MGINFDLNLACFFPYIYALSNILCIYTTYICIYYVYMHVYMYVIYYVYMYVYIPIHIYIYMLKVKHINISCLTNSSNSRKNGFIGGTAFLRWFTKEEIYFIVIWIVGVWYGESSNKFCSCLKEKKLYIKMLKQSSHHSVVIFPCKSN